MRQRGYVAVAAGRTVFQWQNWILHHFANREQCVQAYEASGEALERKKNRRLRSLALFTVHSPGPDRLLFLEPLSDGKSMASSGLGAVVMEVAGVHDSDFHVCFLV